MFTTYLKLPTDSYVGLPRNACLLSEEDGRGGFTAFPNTGRHVSAHATSNAEPLTWMKGEVLTKVLWTGPATTNFVDIFCNFAYSGFVAAALTEGTVSVASEGSAIFVTTSKLATTTRIQVRDLDDGVTSKVIPIVSFNAKVPLDDWGSPGSVSDNLPSRFALRVTYSNQNNEVTPRVCTITVLYGLVDKPTGAPVIWPDLSNVSQTLPYYGLETSVISGSENAYINQAAILADLGANALAIENVASVIDSTEKANFVAV